MPLTRTELRAFQDRVESMQRWMQNARLRLEQRGERGKIHCDTEAALGALMDLRMSLHYESIDGAGAVNERE